jgi:hypothetical protein
MYVGRRRIAIVALLLPLMLCNCAVAQSQKSGVSAQALQSQEQTPSDASAQQSAKPMTPAEARQAQLAADTRRLYQLTQQLKEEVAKSNKDTLSLPIVKKAEEVEKLARSLKERMRAPQ